MMIVYKYIGVFHFMIISSIAYDDLENFKNIINQGLQNSLNYKIPVDARRYQPNNTNIKDYGCYDFIIIGGGTTGSVIASRLSENEQFSVLVIEAGQFADEKGILQIPRYAQTGWLSDYNWGFKSVPQTTSCLSTINNQCMYPRGRGVGGTTLFNGLVYDRGSPENYNIYAKLLNDESWSYKNLLHYFKKSEHFHWTNRISPINLDYHGKHGLLDVQHQVPNNLLNDLFIQANRELGIPIVDYNGPSHMGGTIVQIYTRKGRRLDVGTAFVKPFISRSNLKVLTGSYVTKININRQKVAESVYFTKDGCNYIVKANKEILLSAGTVSSPQILMLSGIGPKTHLEKHGIPVIENLEVGTKFIDQPGTKNFMFSTSYIPPVETLTEQIQDFLNGTGTLTSATICQGISFHRISVKNKDLQDLEVICDRSAPSDLDKKANGLKDEIYKELWSSANLSISFSLRHLYPKSVGTIRLKSNNPFDYPLIDTKYLSDPNNEDIEVLYQGIQHVFRLVNTPAFKRINLRYTTQPLSACKSHKFKSKEYWYCFLRQVALTAAHPVATCSMGTDRNKGAVVDADLKVYGIKKLRVADASVLPEAIVGHTSIPCIMIGEKISHVIKKLYT